MFNDYKSKHTPKVNFNQLALEGSYARSGEQSVYLRARSLVEVFFYDEINGWTSAQVIDGSSEPVSVYLDLPPAVTHISFVSTSSKKIALYRLEEGVTSSFLRGSVAGEEIASTERLAIQGRVADIEDKELTHRAQASRPAGEAVAPGETIDFGPDFANLANKSFLLFVGGEALHEDDYALHADDDGKVIFANGLNASNFAININVVVWE